MSKLAFLIKDTGQRRLIAEWMCDFSNAAGGRRSRNMICSWGKMVRSWFKSPGRIMSGVPGWIPDEVRSVMRRF
jgi:hypothetical protein